MKRIKSFKSFKENATASASSTAGMGAVSSAQPGGLPGTTGTTGSGDISFYMLDKKGKKIKKGSPSEVSDMRYLAPAKGITKLKESNSESRDPKENKSTHDIIEDCLVNLYDDGFHKDFPIDYDLSKDEVDIDDDIHEFYLETLSISLAKETNILWTGNMSIRANFDKRGVQEQSIRNLRPKGSKLSDDEQQLVDNVDDICHMLINHLDYDNGVFTITHSVKGSAMPWNEERNITISIHIVLLSKRDLETQTFESWNSESEYISDVIDILKEKGLRPVEIRDITNLYSDQMINYFYDGKSPSDFVKTELNSIGTDAKFMSVKFPYITNRTITYK